MSRKLRLSPRDRVQKLWRENWALRLQQAPTVSCSACVRPFASEAEAQRAGVGKARLSTSASLPRLDFTGETAPCLAMRRPCVSFPGYSPQHH